MLYSPKVGKGGISVCHFLFSHPLFLLLTSISHSLLFLPFYGRLHKMTHRVYDMSLSTLSICALWVLIRIALQTVIMKTHKICFDAKITRLICNDL